MGNWAGAWSSDDSRGSSSDTGILSSVDVAVGWADHPKFPVDALAKPLVMRCAELKLRWREVEEPVL